MIAHRQLLSKPPGATVQKKLKNTNPVDLPSSELGKKLKIEIAQ